MASKARTVRMLVANQVNFRNLTCYLSLSEGYRTAIGEAFIRLRID